VILALSIIPLLVTIIIHTVVDIVEVAMEINTAYIIITTITMSCKYKVRVMMFNANFNNISAISWRSVLFVEETGVPGENHRPAASH
jgi:hypothetical protein